MGLDTSHGCWSGPYSSFNRWRGELAGQIGLPLALMEGFCPWFEGAAPHRGQDEAAAMSDSQRRRYAPFPWPNAAEEPLVYLLNHSDCGGRIGWRHAGLIADRLDLVVGHIVRGSVHREAPVGSERADYDGFVAACERFAAGLRLAHAAREDVEFH